MSLFVEDLDMPRLLDELADLLGLERGLSDWELDFICYLDEEWNGNFTVKQAETLSSMWETHCK